MQMMNKVNIAKYASTYKGATERQTENQMKKRIERIRKAWEDAAAQPVPVSVAIAIEWKKSRMWGSNPHATAFARYADGHVTRFEATCGGCGYDKESTVVAELLNKCLRGVLIAKGRRLKKLPYGIDWDKNGVWTPRFEGGVGMSCYLDRNFEFGDPGVLQALGWSMRNTGSGKTFDAYELAPKRWRKKKANG